MAVHRLLYLDQSFLPSTHFCQETFSCVLRIIALLMTSDATATCPKDIEFWMV